jgi:hypothetical protein
MKNVNLYEKTGFKNRLKDVFILSVIFITSFIISLIMMDIIILPIAFFAIKDGKLFTLIFKYLFWILIFAIFLFSIFRMIFQLKKDGFPVMHIFKSIIFKPLLSFCFITAVLLVSIILILFLNVLYQNNYHLLYKLINI